MLFALIGGQKMTADSELQIFTDHSRMPGGDAQQRDRRPFRPPAILLPIAQRMHADAQPLGEFRLRQSDETTERRNVGPRFEVSLDEPSALAG